MSKREDIDDTDVEHMYYDDGWSVQNIADYYEASWSTIYYRLHPEKKKENNDNSKESIEKYKQTDKGKAAIKKYYQTEKFKLATKKYIFFELAQFC